MNVFQKVRAYFSGEDRSAIVKKNMLYSFLLKGISIVISFLLVPLTIGYVSSELYGVWLTVSSIMTWFNFLDIGFTQGLKNKLTEAVAVGDYKRGKDLVSTTYFMMLIIFIPVCVILELLIPHINWVSLLNVNPIYSQDILKVLYVMVALICLQMVVGVIVSVIAAFQRVALSNSFSVIGQILSLIIIFIMTKEVPPSLVGLSIAFAAVPIVVTIIASLILYSSSYRNVAPSFHQINFSCIKDLFTLGVKFFIINVQVVVLYQATNILISNVSSPVMVTSYNIAYKYLNIAMMVFSLLTAPLWPAYTDAYVKKDYVWMKSTKDKMARLLKLSILVCVLMTCISGPVYSLWVGNKVEVPFVMTLLVALYVIVYCYMTLNGTLIVGMGIVKVETIIVIIGMLVHIPFSLFLSQYIGAYGVLVSMIVINAAYGILFNIQVDKVLSNKASGIWLE